MLLADFDYQLPPELIAKQPLLARDECRLLYLDRGGSISPSTRASIQHLSFRDILNVFKPGDRLVFNDTRVIPARVFCRKDSGGAVELFFTERIDDIRWRALVKPAKKAPIGTELWVEGAEVKIRIDSIMDGGYERVVGLVFGAERLDDVINEFGRIPLPHYMERDDREIDRELYQTVYAGASGAVAAPTAGLHFTNELLNELALRGIDRSFVTLHVGIGTFRPVQVDDPRRHDIHEERFLLSEQTACEINSTWEQGGRVIAVGTTVVRTLESCAVSPHKIAPQSAKTKLMILPPYEFKAVDGLITNFHLPKSTLLMLVSAFASRESILGAYREAIIEKYRFYSYGDAMLII
ncbi:MAG: tRNA preQ1(34) S-adenosylmethionine ribosyltransferase-isomerase QueA [Chitinispirillales bacterium]|jgi:S-adenosylmethionine:tRNA ribosyltransferase-isomerase|nr:tRNA preQ1(34) S-adenosylmethionine ribosyltransferase-isomerase QueA [Chitinispirillales bacterium]